MVQSLPVSHNNAIIANRIMCNKCGQVLESTYRHDYKECKCGTSVDGGHIYLKRSFVEEGFTELSILVFYNEDGTFKNLVGPEYIEMKYHCNFFGKNNGEE